MRNEDSKESKTRTNENQHTIDDPFKIKKKTQTFKAYKWSNNFFCSWLLKMRIRFQP